MEKSGGSFRQLTDVDIVRLGKMVGNQVNGHEGFELIDPSVQRADHDAVMLELLEIREPFDERRVPYDVDDAS